MGDEPARHQLGGVLVSSALVLRASASILALLAPAAAFAQSSASPFTSAMRYDLAGRVTGTIAPLPHAIPGFTHMAIRNTYDTNGRVTVVEKGSLTAWQSEVTAPASWSGFTVDRTVETTYDLLDRKIVERVRAGGPAGTINQLTQYSYDAVGRLECTAVRMNPAAFGSLPSSACTAGTAGSQGPDRITKQVYDDMGQVLKVQKAYGTAIQQDYVTYTYTNNGKQATVIDANGNKAAYIYDGHDRLVKWSMPDKTSTSWVSTTDYEEYGYDANGNRTSMRKRDGRTFAYGYDNLDRMTVKTVPDGACPTTPALYNCYTPASSQTRDVYYSYDARGLQTAARFDSNSGTDAVINTYDGFGRLTSSTTAMGGVSRTLSYQYDGDGNRTRVTFPDSNYVSYIRDGLNRLYYTDLNGSAMLFTPSYDAAGRISALSRWVGGAWSNYTAFGYDGISRLTSAASVMTSSGYNVTATFAYNPASQLTTRTRDNNLYAFNGYGSVSRSYTANGLNQYSVVGGNSYLYDSNGNLTSDGGIAYNYDAENRLLGTSAGATLSYDPLGRLYETYSSSTGATRFLYDGDQLTAEYNSSGTMLRRYVHSDGDDDPLVWYEGVGVSSPRYLYSDHQGSVVAITDASGSVTKVNAYDEYGIPNSGNTVTTAGRFQYTGQAWIPELGMYYYKARIYSPTLGRFMQTDPIGYKDQINLYAYVGNDPLNHRDPSGLSDVNLLDKDTPDLLRSANELKLAGIFTIATHAVPDRFLDVRGFTNGNKPTPLSPEQMLDIARSNGYQYGQTTFFLACLIAISDPVSGSRFSATTLAKEYARLSGGKVIASTGNIKPELDISKRGDDIKSFVLFNTGSFVEVSPDGKTRYLGNRAVVNVEKGTITFTSETKTGSLFGGTRITKKLYE